MGKLFIFFLLAQLLTIEAFACSAIPLPDSERFKSPITVRVGDRYFTFPQNLESWSRGASKPTPQVLLVLPATANAPQSALTIQTTNFISPHSCAARLKITEQTEACARTAAHFKHPVFQKILIDAQESAPKNWVSDLDIQRELGVFVPLCETRPPKLNPERLSDTEILYALTHQNESIRAAAWVVIRKEAIAKKMKHERLLEILSKEENKLIKSTAQDSLERVKSLLNPTAPAPP